MHHMFWSGSYLKVSVRAFKPTIFPQEMVRSHQVRQRACSRKVPNSTGYQLSWLNVKTMSSQEFHPPRWKTHSHVRSCAPCPILSSHVFSCLSMSTPQFRSFRPLRCIIHFALLQVMVPILHRSQHHFAVSWCDGPQGGSMHTQKYQKSHAIRSCEDCEHCEGSGSRPLSRWVGVHECPEGDDRTQGRTSRWWWEMWRGLIGGAILRILRFRLGHNFPRDRESSRSISCPKCCDWLVMMCFSMTQWHVVFGWRYTMIQLLDSDDSVSGWIAFDATHLGRFGLWLHRAVQAVIWCALELWSPCQTVPQIFVDGKIIPGRQGDLRCFESWVGFDLLQHQQDMS